ncbi:MAG: enoyl-CoA hydratase-related protein [Gammaproteobacteria bacterium]|nr:enoyl-CoA hydratase-related protein [Gammaproteobacteria bacterium]
MADYNTLILERLGTEDRLARITLNRPEKMNALTGELFTELNECLHDLEADQTCRVIIVRGSGRCFSAGYDLTPGRERRPGERRYETTDDKNRTLMMNVRTSMQQITDVQMYLWNMAKITIAQLHGYALAGGCELAMMHDLVVAADDTQIGHPGLRGLGTARNGNIWPLVMSMRKAKEYYYTGDNMTGAEAAEVEMINYAWPKDELDVNTIAFAERIANGSADHLAILKLTMNRFYENMGIYSSVRSATEQDALAQMTEWTYRFGESIREGGLKHAFQTRDEPYHASQAFRGKD